jgi:hypothetical protein
MNDQTKKLSQAAEKKPYAQPELNEREHVDEVVWGQFLTTTGVGSVNAN